MKCKWKYSVFRGLKKIEITVESRIFLKGEKVKEESNTCFVYEYIL